MRILINAAVTILNYQIKIKSNKIFNKTFIRVFNMIHKIFNKIFNDFSDKTIVNQKTVSLSKSVIITEKIISVLNAIIQIIQLKTASSHSI